MNAELIWLSHNAAKEWAGTNGYHRVSQLIDRLCVLCDEVEDTASDESVIPEETHGKDSLA